MRDKLNEPVPLWAVGLLLVAVLLPSVQNWTIFLFVLVALFSLYMLVHALRDWIPEDEKERGE